MEMCVWELSSLCIAQLCASSRHTIVYLLKGRGTERRKEPQELNPGWDLTTENISPGYLCFFFPIASGQKLKPH